MLEFCTSIFSNQPIWSRGINTCGIHDRLGNMLKPTGTSSFPRSKIIPRLTEIHIKEQGVSLGFGLAQHGSLGELAAEVESSETTDEREENSKGKLDRKPYNDNLVVNDIEDGLIRDPEELSSNK